MPAKREWPAESAPNRVWCTNGSGHPAYPEDFDTKADGTRNKTCKEHVKKVAERKRKRQDRGDPSGELISAPNRVWCASGSGHFTSPEDFDTKADGTRNKSCREHIKKNTEKQRKSKALEDPNGEMVRCTFGAYGHFARPDEFDTKADGTRYARCREHVKRRAAERNRDRPSMGERIQDGEKWCSRAHWAPLEEFEIRSDGKEYETCKKHTKQRQEQDEARKQKGGPHDGRYYVLKTIG
jgi:hypothetical protein